MLYFEQEIINKELIWHHEELVELLEEYFKYWKRNTDKEDKECSFYQNIEDLAISILHERYKDLHIEGKKRNGNTTEYKSGKYAEGITQLIK